MNFSSEHKKRPRQPFWLPRAFVIHVFLMEQIKAKPCISSIPQELHIINTQCCISSSRRRVYARLCRDDIPSQSDGWYTAPLGLMICQACGLDKKEVTFGRQKLLLFGGDVGIWTLAPAEPTYRISNPDPSTTWVHLRIFALPESLPALIQYITPRRRLQQFFIRFAVCCCSGNSISDICGRNEVGKFQSRRLWALCVYAWQSAFLFYWAKVGLRCWIGIPFVLYCK